MSRTGQNMDQFNIFAYIFYLCFHVFALLFCLCRRIYPYTINKSGMFYDLIPRNWRQGLERKIPRLLNIQTSKECLPVHSSGGVH